MRTLASLLFMTCLAIPTVGQTTRATINVADHSPADSPLQLSGTIQHSEALVNGKLTVTFLDRLTSKNASDKPIIASVVECQYSSSYSPLLLETKEFDTYFSHDLEIAPGKTYVHEHRKPQGSFSMDVPSDAKLVSPHTECRVVWVQFADSSTWGDNEQEHVKSILQKREILRGVLGKLNDAAAKGSGDFVQSLQLNSGNADVESIIDRIRKHQRIDGTPTAIGIVHQMLEVAATRQQ